MLKSISVLVSLLFSILVVAQQPHWQQQVNYTIDVALNDDKHTLDGFTTITYINNSPDTLTYLWVHLWWNAFKNEKTAFCEQQLRNGNTQFYFSKEGERGYINRLNFQQEKTVLQVEDHPNYIDIVKIKLATPLAPKASTVITTPFHVQLPYNFSRGGHVGQSYQITQWFPKVAMYDATGWNEMPYLDQGEYYSNFGNYKINITVPSNYVVAATGELQNDDEKNWLQSRANFTIPISKPIAKKGTTPIKQKAAVIPTSSTTKTLSYIIDNAVDFAWFADKSFVVQQDSLSLADGHTVLCQSFYLPKPNTVWNNAVKYLKDAVKFRSSQIGNYPYKVATAVEAPMAFSGGMEYPTITSISGRYDTKGLDMVIEHEVGHNWFQAILASNERQSPWLDEGLNLYYDNKYEKMKYTTSKPNKLKIKYDRLLHPLNILTALRKQQPIGTSSVDFTSYNYGAIAYEKTAKWLEKLTAENGTLIMDSIFQYYYNTNKFKHPTYDSFSNAYYKFAKKDLMYMHQLNNNFFETPKQRFAALPFIGINKYDGGMIGGGITNYIPLHSKLRYVVLPLFATKTSTVNGLARVAYNHYPTKGKVERVDIGMSASKFGINEFNNERINLALGMLKLAPFLKVTFKEKAPTSPYIKTVQFRHFNITEDDLNFILVQNPGDTFFQANKIKYNYYINQLQFNLKKTTALYPYNAQLQLEQMSGIVRTTFTADQYFNYNAKEGLWARVFAGKLSYIKAKTITNQFANDRYALNLLAPKGNEDYTYSTYFYGRNEFEGFAAQQILQRDGFFKFRTDLLASKPGRTDNWLAAANLVTDIPAKLNPLSILPIKIPLRIFADIGTYAEAWDKANQGNTKFLYNAGLQLSILKGTIELYLPLVYSKLFTDYSLQMWGKKRSIKNVSFSINLNTFSVRKFIPQINF